jgi:hypothetical protein
VVLDHATFGGLLGDETGGDPGAGIENVGTGGVVLDNFVQDGLGNGVGREVVNEL